MSYKRDESGTVRDHYGRYAVVGTDGKRRGYTRATTIAKTLDDGGGLLPWKATATVVGSMRRPGLAARWQQLIAENPDPWYASEDSKRACKQLVEECAQAGGSADRAEIGTALHSFVELSNRGTSLPLVSADMAADIAAYHDALNAAGVVIDPTMCERLVVLDGAQVAGTSDNLRATLPGYGDVVADLKTGTSLDYGWQSIAVQLAIYAHGDAVYEQGNADDGSTDVRSAMPNISQTHGLIIHLPAGEARCVLHVVDLVAGWEAFERSMWTRDWRKRRALAVPYKIADESVRALSSAFIAAGDATTGDGVGSGATAAPTSPAAPPPFDAPAARPAAKASDYTVSVVDSPQLDIEQVADQLGGKFVAAPPYITKLSDEHEGGPASDSAVAALRGTYARIVGPAREFINQTGEQAKRAGMSFHLKDANGQTVRRFEILRGLVTLARYGVSNNVVDELPQIARAIVVDLGVPSDSTAALGQWVGALGAVGARQFSARCDQFATSAVPGSVDEHGNLRLHFAAA